MNQSATPTRAATDAQLYIVTKGTKQVAGPFSNVRLACRESDRRDRNAGSYCHLVQSADGRVRF